jgi:hypothetical protein
MTYYILFIAIVIVVAGIFGGLVNFYLAKPDDIPAPTKARSMVVGMAASLLVPLFLNMISSNLIDLIKSGDNSKLLVLLGFCLVAAISSTSFIRTISDRVLNEAKQANAAAQKATAQVSQVQPYIDLIVAKETESEENADPARVMLEPQTNEEKLLKTLAEGRWALRTQSGLANETKLDTGEVARLLHDLGQRGLVDKKLIRNGTRWFITDEGRIELARPRGAA